MRSGSLCGRSHCSVLRDQSGCAGAKYNLSEGEVGTPYEADGYYPVEGGRLTKDKYVEIVHYLETLVQAGLKSLIKTGTPKPSQRVKPKNRKARKQLPGWNGTLKELADKAYKEFREKKYGSMKKAAMAFTRLLHHAVEGP